MPYKSLAQERYFNANKAKLEKQGVDVGEWNAASKGKKLPAKAKYDGDPQAPGNSTDNEAGKQATQGSSSSKRNSQIQANRDSPTSQGGDLQLPEQDNFRQPISIPVRMLAMQHLRSMGLGQDMDPAKVLATPTPQAPPAPTPTMIPRSIPNDRKLYGPENPELSGYDGSVRYDGPTTPNSTTQTPNTGTGAPSPTDANNATNGSPFSNYGQNLGQGINPWDNTWGNLGGQYTAPMDPNQTAGLANISTYANQNMGLGGANNYLNNELSGQYLTTNTNPYLAQIQAGMQGQKADQDALENRRIGSAMSAGGNALSGAALEQQGRYQNLSNANYNTSMGNLLSQNYQNERNLQNQAPGQLNNLANTQMRGYQDQMAAGAVPQQLAQQNDQAQYNDWVRSTQNMYNDYTNGGKTFQQLISGNPGSYQPTYGDSQATSLAALLQQLLGKGSSSSSKPGTGTAGGPGNSSGQPNGTTDANGNPVPTDSNGQPMTSAGTDANGIPIFTDSQGNYYQSLGGMTVPMGGIPGDQTGGDVNSMYNNMQSVPGDTNIGDPYAGQDYTGGLAPYDPTIDYGSGGGGDTYSGDSGNGM